MKAGSNFLFIFLTSILFHRRVFGWMPCAVHLWFHPILSIDRLGQRRVSKGEPIRSRRRTRIAKAPHQGFSAVQASEDSFHLLCGQIRLFRNKEKVSMKTDPRRTNKLLQASVSRCIFLLCTRESLLVWWIPQISPPATSAKRFRFLDVAEDSF